MTILTALWGSFGCAHPESPVLADRDPRYARMLGLGDEYELTKPVQISQLTGAIGLRALYPKMNGTHLGYLPAGTRLRVEHAWRVPPEDPTPRIGGALPTLRVLPDHDPLPLPLTPADVTRAWQRLPGGGVGNVYVLAPTHVRRVPPDERTPEGEVEPLSARQEWPRGWRR